MFFFFFYHQGYVSCKHEDDKIIVFDRAGLVFVFNFHTEKSFPDYPIGVPNAGTYKAVLNSDDKQFGGQSRIDSSVPHFSEPVNYANRPNKMFVYIPCRTAIVYARGKTILYTLLIFSFVEFIIIIFFSFFRALRLHNSYINRLVIIY